MYPRSQELVSATRDHDRKRISTSDLETTLRQQRNDLIALQHELSAAYLSDGLLNWQDHFRPFAEFCAGLQPETLVRFADTNTFFRQPRVEAELRYTGNNLEAYFAGLEKNGKWKATLPSPYYFSRLSDDQHYGSVDALAAAFTDVLIQLMKELSNRSYGHFQLIDPELGYRGADKETIKIITDSIARLKSEIQAEISYHIPYTCSGEVAAALLETKLDAIGLDFFHTDIESLPSFQKKKALIAGCVDSRTSLVEDPKTITEFIVAVQAKLEPSEIRLSSNIDLQYVPETIAEKKLRSLKKASSIVTL